MHRRTLLRLAGAAATLHALGARAQAQGAGAETGRVLDRAPPASDIDAWSAYEARLRSRGDDLGGARPDLPGARSLLGLTNRARAAAGAPAVDWREDLAETAAAHAGDMVHRGYVEHLAPEGFDPSHRYWLLARATIGSPSENIAFHRGQGAAATPAQLFSQWSRSPGHWRNLLRPTHTEAGYALLRTEDRAWLVGLYAAPLASLAAPLPFRPKGVEVARALRDLPEGLAPRLAAPQGASLGDVSGRPPVMQISAVRRSAGEVDRVGGPIFLPSNLGAG